MIKTWLIFLLFIIVLCKANHQNLRILTSDVPTSTSNKTLPILWMFYSISNQAGMFYNHRIILSLYSSESIFIREKGFSCDNTDCTFFSEEETSLSLSDQIINGNRIKISGFIDSNDWCFTEMYKPILVESIKDEAYFFYQGNVFEGIIGMGIAKNGRNFPNTFSIYFSPDKKEGYINIGADSSNLKSKVPAVSWPADENWHVHNIKAVIVENSNIHATSDHKVIFDANIDEIVFPEYFQDKIVNAFKLVGTNCEVKDSRMQCSQTLKDKDFPVIEIEINGVKLSIPPQFYVANYVSQVNRWMYTSVKFSSPQREYRKGYTTPEFQHCIIFGKRVIREFYTVFDGVENKITMYYEKKATELRENDSMFSFSNVFMGIIGIFVAVIFWKKCCKKGEEDDYDEEILESVKDDPKEHLFEQDNSFTRDSISSYSELNESGRAS